MTVASQNTTMHVFSLKDFLTDILSGVVMQEVHTRSMASMKNWGFHCIALCLVYFCIFTEST